MGKVYTISKASLKPRRPQFNATRHDYEIQLENFSIVEEVPDEVGAGWGYGWIRRVGLAGSFGHHQMLQV